MSKRQQPGHVASTNRNTAKIMCIMTHYVSVVSGLHPVYQLMSLRLDIIIDTQPGTCPYFSGFPLSDQTQQKTHSANQNALIYSFSRNSACLSRPSG